MFKVLANFCQIVRLALKDGLTALHEVWSVCKFSLYTYYVLKTAVCDSESRLFSSKLSR